jgi:hypothetical protein
MFKGLLILVVGVGGLVLASSHPNIVVEDNIISRNGLGIYVGWYGDWFIQITGNKIEDNGEGIRIVNRKAIIERNWIAGNTIGVRVTSEHEEEKVTTVEMIILRGNGFVGNELYAVQNLSFSAIEAQDNWWGAPEGPSESPRVKILPIFWLFKALPYPSLSLHARFAGLENAKTWFELPGFTCCQEEGCIRDVTLRKLFVDLWDWRVVPVPWIFVQRENLVAGLVRVDNWLSEPPIRKE